jgi:hypothetical protein
MALRATSPLTPDHTSTPRPVNDTFDFDVEVVDRRADTPTIRTLELALAPNNDLFFAGGSKSVEQKVRVGSEPVQVTFSRKRITGSGRNTETGEDLSSFRVTLREQNGDDLVFCLIRIE